MNAKKLIPLCFLLFISPSKQCKKSKPKPSPGIEQCGGSGEFDFGTFFHSLTYRLLDLTTGSKYVTGGWVFFDALSSTGSSDHEFFQCIMTSIETILRSYHNDFLSSNLEIIKSDLKKLKREYPEPAIPPLEKLDAVLILLRHGSIHLKPLSDVRLSEHIFTLMPIWAALHMEVFKMRMKYDINKNNVETEMDIMILYYSKLILRSWRKVRELKCAKQLLCYEKFGPSPAKHLVPGLSKNLNSNTAINSLRTVLEGTKLKDGSVISLRATYSQSHYGIDGKCRNWNSMNSRHSSIFSRPSCPPLPDDDKPASSHYIKVIGSDCMKPNFHGKWLNCKADTSCLCDLKSCSETELFKSACKAERFTLYGDNQKKQIKSGELIYINSKQNLWYLGFHGRDGMVANKKIKQTINLEGREEKEIYDGDIVYFGYQWQRVRFQIFILGSETTEDPATLPSP